MRLPDLQTTCDAASTGWKFARLSQMCHAHRVPSAFVIAQEEFVAALTRAQGAAIAEVLAEMKATIGALFADAVDQITAIAAGIVVPAGLRALIEARVIEVFGDDPGQRFAVRSSGLDEDSAAASLAGLHRSILEVDAAGIVAAVEACWRSYYEPAAVSARIRMGDFHPMPRLAVMVQRMVEPTFAGVAFSGLHGADGPIMIEWVQGLGDRLVAGATVPRSATTDGTLPTELNGVADLVRGLREELGCDVDVEWAVAGSEVILLQVRPVTMRMRETRHGEAKPVVQTIGLYDSVVPDSFDLGEVRGVYQHYTVKRGPAYRLAAQLGTKTVGPGWVIRFNGLGLHDAQATTKLTSALAAAQSSQFIVDAGPALRQIVVPAHQLIERLAEVTSSSSSSSLEHTVIVREFVQGNRGIVSRCAGSGLIVEHTTDGLLALNRGTASARQIVLPHTTYEEEDLPVLAHLAEITAFTRAIRERFGELTAEWVLGDELCFVDYSLFDKPDIAMASNSVVVSAGTANGPILRLDDDTLLRRLSVGPAVSIAGTQDISDHHGLARILRRVQTLQHKPIVSASLPYAVLSVLIGQVAGFLFDEGSVLCHLGILLREAGTPAAIATGAPLSGTASISNGNVTVLRH